MSTCSLLGALRAYERGERADGKPPTETQKRIIAESNERRDKSSYGQQVRKKGRKALTRKQRMVQAARRFRMVHPEKHRESKRKWRLANAERHCQYALRYYHKHRREIAEKRRAKRNAE